MMQILNITLFGSILLMVNAVFWISIYMACYLIGKPIYNFLKGRMKQ